MEARCPACTDATGTAVERDVLDGGGLSVTFECSECEKRWTVVF